MSDPARGYRAFELRGVDAPLALDWLHVHADLEGVLEGEDGGDDGAIVVWLRSELPPLPFDSSRLRVAPRAVAAADFTITGLEHDRAILVADDLLVRPPWVQRPSGFCGIELVVPRGGAFGSGEHGSTRATLRALHSYWGGVECPPASFADVGCGSGILAAYAAARGVRAIAACDIDGPSVVAARELLGAGAKVEVGGPERLPRSELVVANMTAAELHAAFDALLALWTRTHGLVFGGLRADEVDAMVARLVGADAVEQLRCRDGDFTAVVCTAGGR